MHNAHMIIEQSPELRGQAQLVGAKNAVLVIMASLLLTRGKSILHNVPCSNDVLHMVALLQDLGAQVSFFQHEHRLEIDTTGVIGYKVKPEVMKRMRASVLVMGPLLARFGKADIALPGGCVIGTRPIDYHLRNFEKMGVEVTTKGDFISAHVRQFISAKLVLDYPSVGATENLLMAASLAPGITRIINAALEPEVLDLIAVLKKMGAKIEILPPATIQIEGVNQLKPIEHEVVVDRLEAGALLLAAAITGGDISIINARADTLDVLLMKLEEMGHLIYVNKNGIGIRLHATKMPRAVSFKTAPYPGFPTDLQAPMMALQCVASGTSIIEETVFENRLLHVRELQKMGAQIQVEHNKAVVTGVEELYGAQVIATDIRASCALLLAGLVAKGETIMTGLHHFKRGYEALDVKLMNLGAQLVINDTQEDMHSAADQPQKITEI